MKNDKFIFLTVLGLFVLVTYTEAQINFNKVGVGLAYWNRSYSGPDERVILPSYPGEGSDFTAGSFLPTLHAELGLGKNFALEGKIGIWNKKFAGAETLAEVSRRETISQRIIPAALLANYYSPAFLDERVKAFVGIGASRYFIQNEVERIVTGQPGNIAGTTFDGNDYGAVFKIGAETGFAENMTIALEGIYNTGSYTQNHSEEPGAAATKHNISLKGISFGVVLKYNFLSAEIE